MLRSTSLSRLCESCPRSHSPRMSIVKGNYIASNLGAVAFRILFFCLNRYAFANLMAVSGAAKSLFLGRPNHCPHEKALGGISRKYSSCRYLLPERRLEPGILRPGRPLISRALASLSLHQPGLEAVIFGKSFCILLAQGLRVEGYHVLRIERIRRLAARRHGTSTEELHLY